MPAFAPLADIVERPHSGRVLITWILIFLVPPIVGYLLGSIRPRSWRLGLFAAFLAAPPLIVTAWMAAAQPASEGFLLWWRIGMAILLVPMTIWTLGAFAGFSLGKRRVRLIGRRMAAPKPCPPLVINNTTDVIMEISVEMYPDRYLLKPGEEMTIEADPGGVPFTILPFDGGLTIYPGNTAGAAVTVNGKLVEPV